MTTSSAKSPGLWAMAAVATGAASLGANLARRRQLKQWEANPDPLEGRRPHFPPGRVHLIETADGAEIHTVRSGAGPTVMLIHGLTASSEDWGPIAERLIADGIEVVGVDLRGHGHSTLGAEAFSPRRLADDLALVIEHLDLRDLVVAGHSLGGMAVLALAVHHPEVVASRVCGLGLVSTSARLGSLRYRLGLPLAARVPMSVPAALNGTSLMLGVAALSAFGPNPSLFMLRQAVASFSRCPEETRRAATAGMIGHDLSTRIGGITAPTLVLCGTHDLIVPFHHSEQIAAAIPEATLIAVPDAGHLVIWERPHEVSRHLAELATWSASRSQDRN